MIRYLFSCPNRTITTSALLLAMTLGFIQTASAFTAGEIATNSCWIDVATGKEVRTGPPGWSPLLENDNHWSYGGHNWVRQSDDGWIDVATGKEVRTGPPGWSPLLENDNHWSYGGHNWVRIPCPPPPPKCTCSCDDVNRYNSGLFTGDKESVACVKACAEKEAKEKNCPPPSSAVLIQLVIPQTGNNPFNPYNPLSGGPTPEPTPGPTPGPTPPGPPPSPSICTYVYSGWGPCQSNNTQTRTVISSSPPGCTGTPVLTQSCPYTPPGCTTPQPASESQTLHCPAGQIGTITQTRPYSCVGSAWVPGAWTTLYNNCTCDPLVRPQPDGQNIPCPAGQTGTITQQRAYVCSNGTWVPGTNWVEVTRNCTTPQTGCSLIFYHTGIFTCNGGCGVSNFNVSFTPGSSTMQLGGFGSNPTSTFSCNGTTATSPRTFILFGAPGHTVVFNAAGGGSVALSGSRPGASCSDSCR